MKQHACQFILYVSDQNKSKVFYEFVLRTPPILDVPGMTEFRLSDTCKLGLMPESGIYNILKNITVHPSTGSGIPRCELYLHTDNPEETLTRAQQAGAKLISSVTPRDWGDSVGYCADPDGHILALAKKTSKAI
jgi:predicted enzyme related to lactoylglutathione lyase